MQFFERLFFLLVTHTPSRLLLLNDGDGFPYLSSLLVGLIPRLRNAVWDKQQNVQGIGALRLSAGLELLVVVV